jgi:D-beta-D-heptose 7-phosphate kinase/D-beta-D-heptose 1-phosphate adenosyltransferase
MMLSRLRTLLDLAAQCEIACVGDVMLDRYVYGAVDRISPESPIPVMSLRRENAMLGGAGNVARNLAALGARATLVGVVGEDLPALEVGRLLAEEARVAGTMVADGGRPTTVKTRFVAAAQQLLRLDVESTAPLEAAVLDRLCAAAAAAASGAKAVLISDYAKGAETPAVMSACQASARANGAVVIVDPKGPSFATYGPVDLIKPNAKELALVTGLPVGSDEEIEIALEHALNQCEAKALLVTRAGAGMSFQVRGAAPRHVRGRVRQVFDVSGAGDTALAAVGAALAAGAPLEEAVELALLAAGVVVGKVGTAAASPAELALAAADERGRADLAKITALDQALAEVDAWRAQGLTVGFTNGCFDVLHLGHVTYLASARRSCDRLIVGLNTDASVRALKGEGRPVNDLESRSTVLASLSSVDLVLPFAEPTPIELIRAILPDVLLKGADYARDQVVGADVVERAGGRVVLVPLVDGYSTTSAIARMRDQT